MYIAGQSATKFTKYLKSELLACNGRSKKQKQWKTRRLHFDVHEHYMQDKLRASSEMHQYL